MISTNIEELLFPEVEPLLESTQEFLKDKEGLQEYVEAAKAKPPFAEEYTPNLVELLFEGVVYIRYENGEIVASRECTEGYNPSYWEIAFDGETALFVLGDGFIVVDRAGEMAGLDELLKPFDLPFPKDDLGT